MVRRMWRNASYFSQYVGFGESARIVKNRAVKSRALYLHCLFVGLKQKTCEQTSNKIEQILQIYDKVTPRDSMEHGRDNQKSNVLEIDTGFQRESLRFRKSF